MSRILLAEDDRVSRVMLQAVLVKWGHEVVATADGREAFDRIMDPDGPCLAILDWMMPGMTGVEICKQLRATPVSRALHIILLTARSKGADAAMALDAGADDHLAKPYDLVELQARIQLGLRRIQAPCSLPRHSGSGGQDQVLQRILARSLPLNRLAMEAILEDPELLGASQVRTGSCDLAESIPAAVAAASRLLADRVSVSVRGESLPVAVPRESVSQIIQTCWSMPGSAPRSGRGTWTSRGPATNPSPWSAATTTVRRSSRRTCPS